MVSINVLAPDATIRDQIELDPAVFEVEANPAVLHEVMVAQRASRRQGSASSKRRSEIRASGSKAWRQKGTGRARHGSHRAPIFVGGGVTFGPKPRRYGFKPPKKVRRAALRMALSEVAREEGRMLVLEDFDLDEIKTAEAARILRPLTGGRRALVILQQGRDKTARSLRNLPEVTVKAPERLNVHEILRHEVLVFTRPSLELLTEALRSWTRTRSFDAR